MKFERKINGLNHRKSLKLYELKEIQMVETLENHWTYVIWKKK